MNNAERLRRVNIAIVTICGLLLVVCLVQRLWVPAVVNAFFIVSNGVQLATSRRPGRSDPGEGEST